MDKLYKLIEDVLDYTTNVYGCSIFRNITYKELQLINDELIKKFNLQIEVVSQEAESLGYYNNIDYKEKIIKQKIVRIRLILN